MPGKLRMFRNFGLKQIALLIFLLLVILPTLGVGILVQSSYTNILQKQYVESTLRNLDAVVNQLEEQFSMVEDIADYLIYNANLNAYLQSNPNVYSEYIDSLQESVEGLLIFHMFSKPYIQSITIQGLNGRLIEMGEPVFGDEREWQLKASEKRGKIVWSESYSINGGWKGNINVVSLFRVLNLYKDVTTPLGNLTIRLDEDSIVNLLENEQYREEGFIFVVGPNGEQVLQSENALASELDPNHILEAMNSKGVRDMSFRSEGKSFYTFNRAMEGTDWTIVTAIPQSVIDQQLVGVRWLMNTVLFGILLLLIAALIGFQIMIIGPILRLKNETTRVMMGDFTARVPVNSNNEISDLNRKFNAMVDTIQELIDHKYKMEIRERESELKLLQSQVDPHFLYNTLDTIRWTARLENADKASHLIEMLSRFFRSSMNNGQYVTTLQQEMEYVQSYLTLHQVRLGTRLHYALFMEYSLVDLKLPKTVVQPLVENFLIHGFQVKSNNNWIKVNAYRSGDEVWIDVRDNGKGIEPQRLSQIEAKLKSRQQPSDKIGALQNINERLTIFFGSGAGLEIVSNQGQGTFVRVKIPYLNSNGGE
ncbi:sensor histidine kinase [Paenibacillus septentrionalis]|uniref:Sensor histidine kinase n=1 Tax=Paenibacillus septentrionalis TaxID=429342 RepID=A0ABW1V5T4_9BACL